MKQQVEQQRHTTTRVYDGRDNTILMSITSRTCDRSINRI